MGQSGQGCCSIQISYSEVSMFRLVTFLTSTLDSERINCLSPTCT